MNARPVIALGLALGVSAGASAQSLFHTGAAAAPSAVAPNYAESLYTVSMFAIEPPQARIFRENDLITIIVRENNYLERTQDITEEKDYQNSFSLLNKTLLEQFLQFRLPVAGQTLGEFDLASNQNEFEGNGEYEREDRIETRITARVLEVKPNGTLLLEARTQTQTDEEIQTVTLSGICRSLDITSDNTVLSTQLFDLNLNIQHEGQVRRATKKGLIPRAIEALFNF